MPDETFARRTTVSMLSKLKLSVDEIDAGQTDELVIQNLTEEDFPERISVNLFKAFSMLNLVDKTAKITIEASWSPLSPKPKGNFSKIVLDNGHIETFKYVYQKMLPKTSNPSAIIKGKIEYLTGDEDGLGLFQGEVLIKGRDQDNKTVNVRVTLSKEDYNSAFEYIKASEEVEIVGAHHRVSGRKESQLYNYTNFHSLGRRDKTSRPMNLKEEPTEYET